MSVGRTIRPILGLVILFFTAQWAVAQVPVYRAGEYPAPRYPQIKSRYTIDELMPIARDVVRRPYMSAFLKAGYAIQPGHRALIAVPNDFDRQVLEAITRAIREAGGKADVILTDPGNRGPGGDGAPEAMSILSTERLDYEGKPIADDGGFKRGTIIDLAENAGFNILIYGAGGPHAPIKIPWQYIFWDRMDKFITSAAYPDELQQAIDKATWEMVLKSHRVHATDPEGTDLSWTVKPNYWEEAKKTYGFNIVHEGHVSLIPLGMTAESFMESDAQGVIAGGLNHTGPFPHLRVVVSRASVSGIEGGGRYGQLWRQAIDKWKDVQWPGHPGKSINKLWEVAVGTQVKGIRPKDAMERPGGNVWERSRTGVIHWGIGARTAFVMQIQNPEELKQFQDEHHAPGGHVHIHTYFNTVDLTTVDGQTIRIIDKGRLTPLDDPQVRQVAAKYGDPDELLREVWIPAIPGVNVPGDYMEEYGKDPTSYIRKEIADNYKY